MTNENLLLTASVATLFYYFLIYSPHESNINQNSPQTANTELELILDKLITEIQQLTNQI